MLEIVPAVKQQLAAGHQGNAVIPPLVAARLQVARHDLVQGRTAADGVGGDVPQQLVVGQIGRPRRVEEIEVIEAGARGLLLLEGVVEPRLPGHHGFQGAESLLHLGQGGDLLAGDGVVAGQGVGGVGQGYGLLGTVLGGGSGHGLLRQAQNGVAAGKYSIK